MTPTAVIGRRAQGGPLVSVARLFSAPMVAATAADLNVVTAHEPDRSPFNPDRGTR
ncbi:MAG: hypothetical protein ABW137_01045 [Mycobacterium sp.]